MQPEDTLNIGLIIRRTFAVCRRHAGPLAVLAIVFIALPTGLIAALGSVKELPQDDAYYVSPFEGILLFMLGVPATVAATWIALADLDGERVGLAAGLKVGFAKWGGSAWLLFLYQVGIVIGALLLIFPGLMIGARWMAALPAKLLQGSKASAALSTSSELTRPCRGRLIALFAIYIAAYAALWGLTYLVSLAVYTSPNAWIRLMPDVVLYPATTALMSMVAAVGAAVVYDRLERASHRMAIIFD